MNCKPQLLH